MLLLEAGGEARHTYLMFRRDFASGLCVVVQGTSNTTLDPASGNGPGKATATIRLRPASS
ncbi:hypothetical protein [Roseomonas fluvialis]|uniref:Uncharacterized protein n=1 Tax=Roseomonas fluvialis TaxID=1750527 RepID=A0ABN6NVI1_9PROT|nr:hypothetical protein [Roseomonas fluvialis]BDG70453.1 hypothetical protein Rmf_03820 [Roseomonas fluvialis]